jgi:Pectate lyase superfamily protein/Major tropism determinant N-terminal domain
MSIVSISRIQHRRGLQQDLPQLASAELGWSIDQQRLFIGNGTINEGAPGQGNTEILTEHSDILQLAQTYTYKNEDAGYNPITGGISSKYNSIAYGNNTFVAVGSNGAILVSPDAVTWTPVYTPINASFNHICYGNGLFVAVGSTGNIAYSPDGFVWTNATTNTLLTLTSVVYAGGSIQNYVAVSNTGSIAYSSDGNVWHVVPSVSSYALLSIDFNGSRLVAVGNNGTIVTSTNATTWTTETSPTAYNLRTVRYNNDQWIAAGDNSIVIISLDGQAWTFGYTDTFRAAANDGTQWVFVGDGGTIFTTNNTTLQQQTSPTTNNLYDITYSSTLNLFVAVGANGTIISSLDGITWNTQVSLTTNDLNKVIFDTNTNKFITVGGQGTILVSSNANTWTSENSGVSVHLYSISVWSNTTYIAVGASGTVITSPNLTTWTTVATGISNDLESVTVANLGGGTFKAVAVGTGGAILTSDDSGATWISRTSVTTQDLHGVNYITYTVGVTTYNQFFAVGNNAGVVTSVDGITWTLISVPTLSHLFNVYYGLGNFWVVGSVGYSTITGLDLTNYNSLIYQSIYTTFNINTVYNGPVFYSSTYGLTNYILVGQADTVLSSNDGQNFISQPRRSFGQSPLSNADLLDVIYNDSKFVAVGNNGIILTSTDSIFWSGTSYVYGNSETIRTLQKKLDDFVSVKDFGARGDGLADDTEAIDRALYELYCETPNPAARKVLYFPAGHYIVSDGIYLPTNAILRGEGSQNTIIQQTADPSYIRYVFITADSQQNIGSQIGFNGAKLPSDITIEDIGLQTKADGIWVTSCNRLQVSRVNIFGSQNQPLNSGNEYCGVYIIGSSLNQSTDVNFQDCYFSQFNYGVYQPDSQYSRNVIFNSCTFFNMYIGFELTKNSGAVNSMSVSNCSFDLIANKAIDTNYANNIVSSFNSYRDVGNNYQGIGNAVSVIIDYGPLTVGCSSINDQFDRTEYESYSTYQWVNGNQTTIALLTGHELRLGLWEQESGGLYTLTANQTAQPTGITANMSDNALNKKYQYMILRGNNTRSGTLMLTYNSTSNTYNIDDDSSQTGDVGTVFNVTLTGSTLSLIYTSDNSLAGNYQLSIAPSYLKTVW